MITVLNMAQMLIVPRSDGGDLEFSLECRGFQLSLVRNLLGAPNENTSEQAYDGDNVGFRC